MREMVNYRGSNVTVRALLCGEQGCPCRRVGQDHIANCMRNDFWRWLPWLSKPETHVCVDLHAEEVSKVVGFTLPATESRFTRSLDRAIFAWINHAWRELHIPEAMRNDDLYGPPWTPWHYPWM